MSKILLVEDDNNLREIYEARLMAEGYTIVTAPDGEAALAIASQEKPDLVISDVMMPNISGFDMLDIMRNTNGLKNVHVIMLTALSQAEDQARADALGADRYLVKSQVTLEDIVNNAKVLLGDGEAEPAPAPMQTDTAVVPTAVAVAPMSVAEPPVSAPVVAQPVAVAPEPVAVVEPPGAPAPVPVPEPVAVAAPAPFVMPAPQPAQPIADVVDEPVVAAPAPQPQPVAEPVFAPAPVAAPLPVNEAIPEPATPVEVPDPQPLTVAEQPSSTDGLSETAASETATMEAQIQAFVDQVAAPSEPAAPASVAPTSDGMVITPGVTTPQSVFAPAPVAAPVPVIETTAAPEPIAPAPVAAAPVVAPQPAPTEHDNIMNNAVDQLNAGVASQQAVNPTTVQIKTSVGGNKVIQPLASQVEQPSIHQLLAKEEAKEMGLPAAPTQPAPQTGPRPEDIAL